MVLFLSASVLRNLILIFIIPFYIFLFRNSIAPPTWVFLFPDTERYKPILLLLCFTTEYLASPVNKMSKTSEETQQQAIPCGWSENLSDCQTEWFFSTGFSWRTRKHCLGFLQKEPWGGSSLLLSHFLLLSFPEKRKSSYAHATLSDWAFQSPGINIIPVEAELTKPLIMSQKKKTIKQPLLLSPKHEEQFTQQN